MRNSSKFRTSTVIVLNAASATGSSNWISVVDWLNTNLDVRVTGTGTAKIMLSNESSQPSSGNDGPQQGADVTSTSMVNFSVPAKWMKIKVTALSSGTITVYAYGDLFDSLSF